MAPVNIYVMSFGNTKNSHETFVGHLMRENNVNKVTSLNQCDVVIAFVAVVSRAGTNIDDAMEHIPVNKRTVLVVLHHTFDPYFVAPDSRCYVHNDLLFAVDCLFHEDQGLLNCMRNDEAIKAVKQHLKINQNMSSGGQVGRFINGNDSIQTNIIIQFSQIGRPTNLLSQVGWLEKPIACVVLFLVFLLLIYQLL